MHISKKGLSLLLIRCRLVASDSRNSQLFNEILINVVSVHCNRHYEHLFLPLLEVVVSLKKYAAVRDDASRIGAPKEGREKGGMGKSELREGIPLSPNGMLRQMQTFILRINVTTIEENNFGQHENEPKKRETHNLRASY